jgi:chromosome segregation ATPase
MKRLSTKFAIIRNKSKRGDLSSQEKDHPEVSSCPSVAIASQVVEIKQPSNTSSSSHDGRLSQSYQYGSSGVMPYTDSPGALQQATPSRILQKGASAQGPISVDSPGTSPDNSPHHPPHARQDSFDNSYAFSDDGSGQQESLSSTCVSPISESSQKEHRPITPVSRSSVVVGQKNEEDCEDISSLEQQLRDAQYVVKAILGVENVDRNACLKAARQVATMQSEVTQLREGYQAALDEQEELERRLEDLDGKTMQFHGDGRVGANGLADHTGVDKSEYFTESYEEHLESQLASMRELLDQREADMEKLQRESPNQQRNVEETERLKKDLHEARNEIDELEQERELNMGEIVSLTKQTRNVPGQQAAVANADYQDLEEARIRVAKLQQERLVRMTNEEELSRQLDEAHAHLGNYKDCDSDLDYVQRVALLEKRLTENDAKALIVLARKDVEIEKLRLEMHDQSVQSNSWEAAASESSAQILKMASYLDETQDYQATLEIENRDLLEQLEEADTKIAEFEDKHWMRDQKLAGLTTMYQASIRKLKVLEDKNDATRSSFSNPDLLTEEAEDSGSARSGSVELKELKSTNKELRRKMQDLSSNLETSERKIEKMASNLEVSKAKELTIRAKILELEEEKKKMENDLLEMEDRVHATEKKRTSDASLALGLGAKEVATNTRILKLEQEKRTMEKRLFEMQEKNGAKEESVVDSGEKLDTNMQLQTSRSTINKLQSELVESKREIEESQHSLESERSARTFDVKKLTKDLEESQAKVSVFEKKFERYLRQGPLGGANDNSLPTSIGENAGNNASVDSEARAQDLVSQLVAKDNQLRKWEEDHAMQVDQVNGLRERLTEALTNMEDLEYESNFNNAKVQELTLVNTSMMQSDDDELHGILRDKAVQCAELETKLAKAEKDATERKKAIEKLEMERSVNKAKVAELSSIWDSQAQGEKARKAVLMKAMEVADQLNESLQRIEQLEIEKERSAAKAGSLGLKLSKSVQMVDELAEKLEAEVREKNEMEQIMRAAGVTVVDLDNKSSQRHEAPRKRVFSFAPGANQIKPEENERIKQLEEALTQQRAAIADLTKTATPRPQPPAGLLSGQL